ncbi:hypothetical protein Tcan_10949 [Toxocara canis]|uniref:Uncharacterized protein n=1 Tax=Toxocara canis TaxID=6265 RepID=A0A0B2V6S2_TOXCA|nr:hypothetical protein Tcan_10949 [Toxocara canis]
MRKVVVVGLHDVKCSSIAPKHICPNLLNRQQDIVMLPFCRLAFSLLNTLTTAASSTASFAVVNEQDGHLQTSKVESTSDIRVPSRQRCTSWFSSCSEHENLF